MIDSHLAGALDFVHKLPTKQPIEPGRHALGLFKERDAVLYVPRGVHARKPSPLIVLFHGGGGSAAKILPMLERLAEQRGFLLLAPQSLFPTWDLVIGGNGPDRQRLDVALAAVAERFMLDPTRLAFAGHSDGGSYALSLGLANGHFVTRLIISSAGFMSVHMQVGIPRIFIAHGIRDEQIPIARSGQIHAARLREAGYEVTYREYDGPHDYQPCVIEEGVEAFLADGADC